MSPAWGDAAPVVLRPGGGPHSGNGERGAERSPSLDREGLRQEPRGGVPRGRGRRRLPYRRTVQEGDTGGGCCSREMREQGHRAGGGTGRSPEDEHL